MKSRAIHAVVFGLGMPLLLAASCNQAARPAPEAASSQSAPSVDTTNASDSGSAEVPAASAENKSTPPSEPGEVALPPSSASAWNNAQSDGKAPAVDRSIKDYQAIVQNNRNAFRACYDEVRAKNPGIKGNVVLKFKLDPKGAVMEGGIEKESSDITLPELESCMVKALKGLSFPASSRGMESTVKYPFTFNPGGGGGGGKPK